MPRTEPLTSADPRRLGEYEVIGRLGEGGQGTVYLAARPGGGDEHYAVKLLYRSLGEDRHAFLREAELAKQVARFCIAQVVGAGLAGDRPYIVSEFVDGPSLQREVEVGGPRAGGALERLAIGTATALAAIHRAGIVHRDFKPQNVLLGPDGPRVIDFGLARALDTGAAPVSGGAGTPAYMAPEQVEGAEVGPAADVFAWGATVCFAANAWPPFGHDSVAAVLHRVLTAPPELGRLDGWLGRLVAGCLAKDFRDRPTSRELLLALLGEDGGGPSAGVTSRAGRTGPPRAGYPAGLSSFEGPAGDPSSAGHAGDPSSGGHAADSSPAGHPAGPPPFEGSTADPSSMGHTAGPSSAGRAAGHDAAPGPAAFPARVTEPPAHPRRAVTRASVAMSGALLVSAAVLAGALVPAVGGGGSQAMGGGLIGPSAETGTRDRLTAHPGRTARPAENTSGATAPRVPPTRSQTGKTAVPPGEGASTPPPAVPGVSVPALAGLDHAEASRLIEKAGLILGALTRTDSDRRIGQVVGSRPRARATVARGTRVDLEISAGVAVPRLAGLDTEAAGAALTRAGLARGAVTTRCSARPGGEVLASTPGAGARASSGDRVALVVSRRGTAVPSVAGRTAEAARDALSGAGLAVRLRPRLVDDPERDGKVLAQSPEPGGCAAPGATVVITVGVAGQSGPGPGEPSTGPDPSAPPDPPATEQPGPSEDPAGEG
ncbi:PASTA domain-containing protein [Streptosporangium sp. NPDC004379]|uniref:serine/threonine-protein kinase n=1 Tax=Streptosporangium sp. NPDC004379 TaxID=3366189 RepID=UPI003677C649